MEHIQKLAIELGISYEEASSIIDDSYSSNAKNYEYDDEVPKKIIHSEFSSEDIQQIIDITNIDIKDILLHILLKETSKKESGQQYTLNMKYCIGLAHDKYNDKLKKIRELINKEVDKEVHKKVYEEVEEEVHEEVHETDEERRKRIRDSWIKKF